MSYRRKHISPKIRHLRPKKSLLKRPLFWVFSLSLLLAAGIFYLFFFFPKFQVQAVEVSGNEKIITQDIEALAWQDISKKILGIHYKSIFTVDSRALKKHMLTVFPAIEEVTIEKKWFKTIYVKITERKPFAVFCPNKSIQGCFFIDKYGVIYQIAEMTTDNLIVRQSVDETKLAMGQALVDKNMMDAIALVHSSLKNNFQIEVKEVAASNPLIFTTQEKWQIYFDPTQDIDMQITKMNLLLKNEITPAIRKNLNYIYLQYQDRAYYK